MGMSWAGMPAPAAAAAAAAAVVELKYNSFQRAHVNNCLHMGMVKSECTQVAGRWVFSGALCVLWAVRAHASLHAVPVRMWLAEAGEAKSHMIEYCCCL